MKDLLDTVIAAYECWNGPYEYGKCDYCPYGYSYLDDSGDGRPFYACDEEQWTKDAYTWLKMYQYLRDESENKNV